MDKKQFLDSLRAALSGLPQDCIEESLSFYGEMIDDRIEDGLSEEEAVSAMGCIDDAAEQVLANVSLFRIAKEKVKPKRKMRAWEIVLLAVGSPIWFSLLIAAFAVVLSLYVVLWSVIITLWSVFTSFAACAVGGTAAGVILICVGNVFGGILLIGGGILFAGLAIFLFFGCKEATRGMAILTKKIALGIKRLLVRKERV